MGRLHTLFTSNFSHRLVRAKICDDAHRGVSSHVPFIQTRVGSQAACVSIVFDGSGVTFLVSGPYAQCIPRLKRVSSNGKICFCTDMSLIPVRRAKKQCRTVWSGARQLPCSMLVLVLFFSFRKKEGLSNCCQDGGACYSHRWRDGGAGSAKRAPNHARICLSWYPWCICGEGGFVKKNIEISSPQTGAPQLTSILMTRRSSARVV